MILSDTLPPLFQAFMGVALSRTQALIGVTIFAILPLCLLKDTSSLAIFSFLGTAGMIYTAIAMAIRYFQGSYALPDGKFLEYVDIKPSFGHDASIWSPNVFVLLSVLSSATMCHFISPRLYHELKDNTVARFNTVVTWSFAISITLFIAFSSLGFLTFGASSAGLVLNNYATNDSLMSVSRLAVAASIVFGYVHLSRIKWS
jgi:amino acid permease